MAVPTNTFTTYSQVGAREELKDEIYLIDPSDTPFLSSVRQVTVDNKVFEWQTDSLAAASDLKALEGDDAPQTAVTATTRLNNYTQISTLDARVAGSAMKQNVAGRDNDLSWAMLKRARELKRSMETTLLSNKAKVAGNATTARETAAIGAWIKTNTDKASDGTDPTAADGTDARNDGTQRALTEAQVKAVLVKIFDSGGNPDTIMVNAFNRQNISAWTGNSTSFQKAEDKVLHATFDVYAGDFGQLKIVPNRFQRGRDALILEMEKWQVGFLEGRNMATWDLAKTGDSEAKQILSEYGLLALNEAASGGVFDLTTS